MAYSWVTTSSQLIILMLKESFPSLQSGSKPQPQTLIQPFLAEALSGDLCKSGPVYFASEKSFPSNFAQ